MTLRTARRQLPSVDEAHVHALIELHELGHPSVPAEVPGAASDVDVATDSRECRTLELVADFARRVRRSRR